MGQRLRRVVQSIEDMAAKPLWDRSSSLMLTPVIHSAALETLRAADYTDCEPRSEEVANAVAIRHGRTVMPFRQNAHTLTGATLDPRRAYGR